jgi:hypothetical protein
MRLLNTRSFGFKEFTRGVPPYAILSHRWGTETEEVLYNDIKSSIFKLKKAFAKVVEACCRNALEDGFEWVWIDTCCIDKSSSAELSEAINSMYAWYKNSTVCYVFLQDVASDREPHCGSDEQYEKIWPVSSFERSEWFHRGWTLQELIAPDRVEFYTCGWVWIGTKRSLAPRLEVSTKIPTSILNGRDLETCCVAQRMSWASNRQTTRVEDGAYCLLGIFGVNMPLLYGEGSNAFIRLQQEILRQKEDYSLFAWSSPTRYAAHPWCSIGRMSGNVAA